MLRVEAMTCVHHDEKKYFHISKVDKRAGFKFSILCPMDETILTMVFSLSLWVKDTLFFEGRFPKFIKI